MGGDHFLAEILQLGAIFSILIRWEIILDHFWIRLGAKSGKNPSRSDRRIFLSRPHTNWPGGMRGAIESAAPKRRPKLALQTPAELAGVFRPPPARARAFRRATVHLNPTDPFGTLGRFWAGLGALLWRS